LIGSPPPRRASHLALVLALLLIEALVVQFLPLRQRKRHLRPPSAEMHVERYERESLPFDGPDQPANLPRVQKQLACTSGLVIELIPLLVRRDVRVDEEDL